MIDAPLKLIYDQMEILGLQSTTPSFSCNMDKATASQTSHNLFSLPMDMYSVPATTEEDSNSAIGQQNDPILLDLSYLKETGGASANLNILDMSPDTYEAFLQAEPISVTMNPGFDIF